MKSFGYNDASNWNSKNVMEPFFPGAAYGYQYRYFIWVCVNATPRSFEQCDIAEGQAVLARLTQAVQRQGLGAQTLIFKSSCLMGCKKDGTTVVVTGKHALNEKGDHQLFFNNVQAADAPALVETYLR